MTTSSIPHLDCGARQSGRGNAALRIAATLAIVSLSMLSCATSGVNSGDFNLISLDDEWQLGAQLERDLSKELKLVRNGKAAADLERIGNAIVGQTELADRPWTFHLVNDPALNAFNIPGGHVYVNTGLVAAAPDAAAFAGVLGHEIAHGVARHGTEQLTKAHGINVLAGLLLGQNPALYEQILAQILAGGAVARFSRQAEREADDLGVRYSYESGYDPMGLPRMLEVLAEQSQRQPVRVERFFATHPMTQERIDQTRDMASSFEGGRRDDPAFADLQRVAARAN
jgi:beta-barrel assembly-enhancing protease